MLSNSLMWRAERGNGCKSSSGVGGGNFSGRMRYMEDISRRVSAYNHRSEMINIYYFGGTGSKMGTVTVSCVRPPHSVVEG